jgi:hypothetical protein
MSKQKDTRTLARDQIQPSMLSRKQIKAVVDKLAKIKTKTKAQPEAEPEGKTALRAMFGCLRYMGWTQQRIEEAFQQGLDWLALTEEECVPFPDATGPKTKEEQIVELEAEVADLRDELARMWAMVHEICEEHGIDPEEELRNAEPKTD